MQNTTIINSNGINVENNVNLSADFSMVFSVKDLKSDNFGSLLFVNSIDEAIRALKVRLMYEQNSLMQQFPSDFMLYHVGYFNSKTGEVKSVGVAIPVKSVLDVSLELRDLQKPLDVPEFLKGESEDDNGNEKSNDC